MMTLLPSFALRTLLISASLAAAHAFGTSVASDPSGAITYHFPATSDTNIGLAVARPSAFEGRVASVNVETSTITFQGNPEWTPDAFSSGEVHYLYVKSGAEEGMHVTVTGNTADSVTVFVDTGDRLDRIVVGEYASIVPYWTPSTFFADAAYDGLRIHFYRDRSPIINYDPSLSIEFSDGEWRADGSGEIASNTPIYPNEAFIVRNTGPTLNHPVSGTIPMAAARIVFRSSEIPPYLKDQRFSFFTPVPFQIDEILPLVEGDVIYGFNMTTSAYHKSATEGVMYGWGDWYDYYTWNVRNDYIMQAGRGYMYRGFQNATANSVVLVKQQPYLN